MGQAREVIDRATEAMMNDDLEAFREVYADDVVVTTPDSGTLRGVDALYAWNHDFVKAFSDIHWDELAIHETADSVISQGEMVATHTGDFPVPGGQAVPATGKQMRVREADVAKVENGKIVRHDFYFDQLDMMVQLGLVEAPAATQT
jgi:ketosteroid isomerase-like protein